jgi:hypothetical protein
MKGNEIVIYKSGIHPTQGWDVVQVILKDGSDRAENSFVISRDSDGNIRRKTDILFDRWEVVTDEDDLLGFRRCFEERDKAVAKADLKNTQREMPESK